MTKTKHAGNPKKTGCETLAVQNFKNKVSSDIGRYFNHWGARNERKVLWKEVCQDLNVSIDRNDSTLWKYVKDVEDKKPPPPFALSLTSSLTKTDVNGYTSCTEIEDTGKKTEKVPLLEMTRQLALLSRNYHEAVAMQQEAIKNLKETEQNMDACRISLEKFTAEFMSSSQEDSARKALMGLKRAEK